MGREVGHGGRHVRSHRIKDQEPRIKDRIKDQGSDQGSRITDLVLARMNILEEIRTRYYDTRELSLRSSTLDRPCLGIPSQEQVLTSMSKTKISWPLFPILWVWRKVLVLNHENSGGASCDSNAMLCWIQKIPIESCWCASRVPLLCYSMGARAQSNFIGKA